MQNLIISLPCIKLSGLLQLIESEGLQALKDDVRQLADTYPHLIDLDAAMEALDAFAEDNEIDSSTEEQRNNHIVGFGHALGIGAVSYS